MPVSRAHHNHNVLPSSHRSLTAMAYIGKR